MSNMQDVLLPELAKGVHAGALKAIEVARRTGTKLVVWQYGKTVEISPDEAEAMMVDKDNQQ